LLQLHDLFVKKVRILEQDELFSRQNTVMNYSRNKIP